MTREEAIKTLKENYCAMCAYGSQDMDSCDIRSCDNRDAIKALEQEPRKGHWIDEGIYADGQSYHAFMCSECGWHHIENKSELVDFKYCPFCGADMREVEE